MFKVLLKKVAAKAKARLDEHLQPQNDPAPFYYPPQRRVPIQQQNDQRPFYHPPQQLVSIQQQNDGVQFQYSAPQRTSSPSANLNPNPCPSPSPDSSTFNHILVHKYDFSNFGVPRQVSPQNVWGLCEPCSVFGCWLDKGVQTGIWEPFKQDEISTANYFDLGFLDVILATNDCRLCRLISRALREKFTKLPLSYNPPGGRKARQVVTVDSSQLLDQKLDLAIQIGIILASDIVTFLQSQDVEEVYRPPLSTLPAIGLRVIEEDATHVPAAFVSGAGVGKQVPPGACDIRKLIEVYQSCRHQHGSICETPRHQNIDLKSREVASTPTIGGFRVIDIQNMCIVDSPIFCRYVALSYVWGKQRFLVLTTENLHILRQPRALEYQDIPRTVREAIILCRMLGERYLWVDALCIVQDDDATKIPQITQMDKIYLSAALTIISADGESAGSGLTGFMPDSRTSKQNIENISGLRFVSISAPILEDLAKLKWYTRAWTYQEYVLSKRMMIFTNYQVFYFCNLRNFCEDSGHRFWRSRPSQVEPVSYIWDHPHWDVDMRHQINIQRNFRNDQVFHAYMYLVKNITSRDITVDTDILRSVTGILAAMGKYCDEKFISGIPSSMLEWAIFWYPDDDELHERGNTSDGKRFPSWSWIGWKGAIKYLPYSSPLETTSLIQNLQFYTASPTSSKLLPYRPEANPKDPYWTPTTWLALPTAQDPDTAYELHVHQATVDSLVPLIESGVLSFTAQTATFRLETVRRQFPWKDTVHRVWRIIHPQTRTWVGTMNLGPKFPSGAAAMDDTAEVELVAISRTRWAPDTASPGVSGQDTFDTNVFRGLEDGATEDRKLLVAFIWIRWAEGGMVRRVATGQMHIDAWESVGPRMGSFQLG